MLQIYKVAVKYKLHHVYGYHDIRQEWKRIKNPYTKYRKLHYAYNEKRKKNSEGIELFNQESIRILRGKENYLKQEIFEGYSTKKTEVKWEIKETRKFLEIKLCCKNLIKK